MRLAPKLGLMIGIPLLALLLVAGRTVVEARIQTAEADNMSAVLKVAQASGRLMNAILEEDRIATIFLDSRGKKASDLIGSTRNESDAALQVYKLSVESLPAAALTARIEKRVNIIDKSMQGWAEQRDKISARKTRSLKTRRFYSKMTATLLELIEIVPWESPDNQIAVATSNYAQTQHLIVLAKEEQAVLAKVFKRDSFVGSEFTRFSRAIEF